MLAHLAQPSRVWLLLTAVARVLPRLEGALLVGVDQDLQRQSEHEQTK
jgi:hypothetical protein